MPVTPQDIVDKVFTKSFRGYDEEEVDLFLDEIIKEMGKQGNENSALRAKVDELTLKLGMMYASLQSEKGNMSQAQHKAQEYLNNTNIKARLMVEQAQRKARDTISRAEAAANTRVSEAQKQAAFILQEARAEAARLQTHIEREAMGLASSSIFADAHEQHVELELLTKKIERAKAELGQLEQGGQATAQTLNNALPVLDFSTMEIEVIPYKPPPMPQGYEEAAAHPQAVELPEKAETPASEDMAEGMPAIELIETPETLTPQAEAEQRETENWLADEAALPELLPPGWDNLETLSDDELSMLMKALGIAFDEEEKVMT